MSEILTVIDAARTWLILDCGHWYKWTGVMRPPEEGTEFDCPSCKPLLRATQPATADDLDALANAFRLRCERRQKTCLHGLANHMLRCISCVIEQAVDEIAEAARPAPQEGALDAD